MSVKEDIVSLLKRVREMCLNGQVSNAELELHSVHRRAGCSATTKIILAALLARRGKHVDARAILKCVKPETIGQCSPSQIRLTISILISLGDQDRAEQLGRAYHKAFGHEATRWLRDMSIPGARRLYWSPGSPTDELARCLANEPKAIQALVFAQHHQRNLSTVKLLRMAIRRIVPLFENDARQMTLICRAMAELALLEGDQDQARRWAHRGLEEDPYNATFALLINKLRDTGDTALPPATVLACVAKHHPTYPDVQAALIRRESDDGRNEDAKAHLAEWLKREPHSRQALELQQELAA
jgi:hypothetical protein